MFKLKSLISLFSEAGQSIFILFCSSPSGCSVFGKGFWTECVYKIVVIIIRFYL